MSLLQSTQEFLTSVRNGLLGTIFGMIEAIAIAAAILLAGRFSRASDKRLQFIVPAVFLVTAALLFIGVGAIQGWVSLVEDLAAPIRFFTWLFTPLFVYVVWRRRDIRDRFREQPLTFGMLAVAATTLVLASVPWIAAPIALAPPRSATIAHLSPTEAPPAPSPEPSIEVQPTIESTVPVPPSPIPTVTPSPTMTPTEFPRPTDKTPSRPAPRIVLLYPPNESTVSVSGVPFEWATRGYELPPGYVFLIQTCPGLGCVPINGRANAGNDKRVIGPNGSPFFQVVTHPGSSSGHYTWRIAVVPNSNHGAAPIEMSAPWVFEWLAEPSIIEPPPAVPDVPTEVP